MGGLDQPLHSPNYRAIIFRRSFPELKDVIAETKKIYPLAYPGASYHETDKEWRFPSGARIEMSFLEADTDVFRYQGRQFQYIGWEELPQWPTAYAYEYMVSRLRAPAEWGLKLYIRATGNPDGPGAPWVQERFGIPDSGSASYREVVIEGRTFRRRFIPARLSDNPYLAGTGYREALLQMPEHLRKALLDGRWDVRNVPGAIYAVELEQARERGRITKVPYDPMLPVFTYWDLGIGDSTAIWFEQRLRQERRLIDYYEASGESLQHYARVLQTKPYVYGKHYAPHDIQVRELSSGKSRIELAAAMGIRFEVAPNIGIEDGINAVRMQFANCWFDAENCKRGIDCLQNYRRQYNKALGEHTATPVHDQYSHGADAFRYLAVTDATTREKKKPRDRFFEHRDLAWMAS